MPPSNVGPKRKPKDNQYLFDLGVRGRKTGITLPDTGIRDENGMEPMDGLFSSPTKPSPAKPKGKSQVNGFSNRTLSSEADMDVGESMLRANSSRYNLTIVTGTIPEPTDVLEQRASFRLPPKSKSPIKTFLQSPARRNPSIGPVSSPTRGSIVAPRASSVIESVRRKLDFSNNDDESEEHVTLKKRAVSVLPIKSASKLQSAPQLFATTVQAMSPEIVGEEYSEDLIDNAIDEDSFQMVDAGEEEDNEPELQLDEPTQDDEELELEPVLVQKGKRKAMDADDSEEPLAKSRGRPKKIASPVIEEEEEVRPAKRTRRSLNRATELPKQKKAGRPFKEVGAAEPEIELPIEDSGSSKRGRKKKFIEEDSAPADKSTSKGKKAALAARTAPHDNKRGPKKSKLESIQEDSSDVKRGPPLPRNNRGLVLLRRQTPSAGIGFQTTRSGRNSHKPIEYWRGERVEYSEDEEEDEKGGKVLLSRVKQIVRVDQDEAPPKKKSKAYKPKPKRRTELESESDDDKELWEEDPGRIRGDTIEWRPQESPGPERSPIEQEIALSSEAIITRDVKDGHFKFAKTLSLPFFGAGVVDLPPGTEKFMKNSKQMCMVFFVHYGRVHVRLHETEFRIGKGGIWQVPRGNWYGIKNDYDKPVRLFFAQGNALIENMESSEAEENPKSKPKGKGKGR